MFTDSRQESSEPKVSDEIPFLLGDKKSFYKFCGLLVSRKENICISLVLVAHF
jgi:hypothetical protein